MPKKCFFRVPASKQVVLGRGNERVALARPNSYRESGAELRRFAGHQRGVRAVAALADSRRALSVGYDRTLHCGTSTAAGCSRLCLSTPGPPHRRSPAAIAQAHGSRSSPRARESSRALLLTAARIRVNPAKFVGLRAAAPRGSSRPPGQLPMNPASEVRPKASPCKDWHSATASGG
jgi:hypothetical protein